MGKVYTTYIAVDPAKPGGYTYTSQPDKIIFVLKAWRYGDYFNVQAHWPEQQEGEHFYRVSRHLDTLNTVFREESPPGNWTDLRAICWNFLKSMITL